MSKWLVALKVAGGGIAGVFLVMVVLQIAIWATGLVIQHLESQKARSQKSAESR